MDTSVAPIPSLRRLMTACWLEDVSVRISMPSVFRKLSRIASELHEDKEDVRDDKKVESAYAPLKMPKTFYESVFPKLNDDRSHYVDIADVPK